MMEKEWSRGALLSVTFLGQARKVTKKLERSAKGKLTTEGQTGKPLPQIKGMNTGKRYYPI